MCGRYYISKDEQIEELAQIIEKLNRNNGNVKLFGEIFPTDTVPVIANNKRLQPRVFAMKWGYTLSCGIRLINTRSETAAEKTMFRESFQAHRCLIPATNYFEWDSGKTKYAIKPTNCQMFYMAGIYRIENNLPVFSILTRTSVENLALIHNRMPVILSQGKAYEWLDLSVEANRIIKEHVQTMQYAQA